MIGKLISVVRYIKAQLSQRRSGRSQSRALTVNLTFDYVVTSCAGVRECVACSLLNDISRIPVTGEQSERGSNRKSIKTL